jgi:hypothetical protein
MTTFTARRETNHQTHAERWGCVQWTVFVDDPRYPYTLCNVRQDIDPEAWTVYCLSRRDIGMNLVDTQKFDTRDEAFAFIRETYEAALANYHGKIAEAFSVIRQGLSTVEPAYRAMPEGDRVILGVIFPEAHQKVQFPVTIREATIEGSEAADTITALHRHRFDEWSIPAGSNDYHLCGWRSREGVGRR